MKERAFFLKAKLQFNRKITLASRATPALQRLKDCLEQVRVESLFVLPLLDDPAMLSASCASVEFPLKLSINSVL